MNISRTKKLTTTGMLCALAYVAVVVGRIPLILFLKYDPKDVIIVIGGFLFGPITSFTITVIVSLVQMLTVSGTGVLGCIMNIIPREAIVELLLPAFLPFNLIKGGLNAAITMLLYKPVVTVLRRSNLIEPSHNPEKTQVNIGVLFAALLIILTCVLLILSLNRVI